MKTILAMGQSNAVGRADGGGWNIPASVTVWNNANDIEDLSQLGSAFVAPDRNTAPFVSGKNNIFVHAAKYLSQLTSEDVRLILVAKGGIPIAEWDGKTSPMYSRMKAILTAAGVSKVDAFFWHQGENDASAPSGYAAKWNGLIANLTSDGIIDQETPIMVGEVAPANEAINPVLHSLADLRTDIAPLKMLETFDNVHFKASACIEAGFMYAERAFALLPDAPPVIITYPNGVFVSACGIGSVNIPSGVDVKIPVSALYGEAAMISSDGAFIAPFSGIFRFMVQGYAGKAPTRLKMLDDAGQELRFVAYSGGSDPIANNSILSGWCDIQLPQAAKAWLGLQQNSGSASTLSSTYSPIYCKMAVNVMKRDL